MCECESVACEWLCDAMRCKTSVRQNYTHTHTRRAQAGGVERSVQLVCLISFVESLPPHTLSCPRRPVLSRAQASPLRSIRHREAAWFVPCVWPPAQAHRAALGVPPCDFHISPSGARCRRRRRPISHSLSFPSEWTRGLLKDVLFGILFGVLFGVLVGISRAGFRAGLLE